MSRKVPPPAAVVLAKNRFASAKRLVTLLEKEDAAAHPNGKKSRNHTAEKAAIAKIMNDHFRALSREDKYVKTINNMNLEEPLEYDRGKLLKADLTMGSTFYQELRILFGAEQTAFKAVVVEDEAQSEDEELEEALFQAGIHIPETWLLCLWLD